MAQRRRNGDAEEGKGSQKNRPSSKAAVPSAPLRPDEEQDFVIYTDGSCLRNPDGPGGWAVVARNVATGEVTELSDGNPSTTNNRMELLAAIMALRFAPEGTKVALYTDSQYLKNGITKWVAGWKRRGWKKPTASPSLTRAAGSNWTNSTTLTTLPSTGSKATSVSNSTNAATSWPKLRL